jgi:hypothetical protein
MKKVLSIVCLILISLSGFAQSGTGISSDPYYGDISTSQVWSIGIYPGNTVYVGTPSNPDLRVITNGQLTIDPGITVIFKELGSDLIITGTGRLTAGGTGSVVTFTKDASKSHRGHISFQSMDVSAGTSAINNCIIEYGDVSSTLLTPANPNQYGGAIHADLSNLTISNCEIRNNKAGFGGGIFVGDGKNPSISNCYIHTNTATTSGGGIYFWRNSYSVFTNSIIASNICSGTGGGGGIFIGGTAKNVKVINCVISHNTANTQSLGHNIKIFTNTNSPKPQIINSIIWYPANSIVGSIYTTDFVNCAIQDPPLSYPTSIPLNALNEGTSPDGPFFSAMSGNNWPLQFRSPCRDAGTTPSPAVPLDYIGNSRIGPYDIGAYEVQYNRWKTTASSTDWATTGNWDGGVPTSSSDVVIPTGSTNYPTGSISQNFTIGSGKYMILEPGAKTTLATLTNNGTLRLQSSATGISSLIVTAFSGNDASVELYLTGGGIKTTYKWHYISTPVLSLPVSTFAPGTTLDVAQWVESRPTLSLREGWVAYDGYIYSTGGMGGPTFSNLTPGKGYNYWDNLNNKFTFSGQLNTADAPMALGFSGDAILHGFNLLGNPFSSGLNWNDIINNVYFTYPLNTSKSLYFTRDNIQCSYISGVGIPGDVTGIIPPMQGFMTKTYSTGNTLTIPAAARVQDNIHPTYKGSTIIPLVRLSLAEDTLSDETVVRFDNAAKASLDYDYDALKMFLESDIVSIYSSSPGTKYAINGLPFPETFVEIPIVINLTRDTIHTISATQLQGLDNYTVTLTDNTTGFTANLKTTPVLTFSAATGTIADRFILKVSTGTTGTENPNDSKNFFNIYPSDRLLNIQTMSDEWDGKSGSVTVLDMTGKRITSLKDAEFSRNSIIQVPGTRVKGIYFVEMQSGVMKYVGKVVIK